MYHSSQSQLYRTSLMSFFYSGVMSSIFSINSAQYFVKGRWFRIHGQERNSLKELGTPMGYKKDIPNTDYF